MITIENGFFRAKTATAVEGEEQKLVYTGCTITKQWGPVKVGEKYDKVSLDFNANEILFEKSGTPSIRVEAVLTCEGCIYTPEEPEDAKPTP